MVSTDQLNQNAKYLINLVNGYDIKAYFLFLKEILNEFNSFNAFFQATETRIHLLHSKSVKLLTTICEYFLKPELLKALQNNSMQWNLIQFHEKDNQKPLEEIKLGFECEEYLNTIENEENTDAMRQYKNNLLTNIRKNCLQFCITAAQEIIKRLPITINF